MDAAFKLKQVGYPVIVCGISGKCRSFHLVALFITSQRLEDIYLTVPTEPRRIFASVSGGRQLVVKFVIADAEAAQQNAVVCGLRIRVLDGLLSSDGQGSRKTQECPESLMRAGDGGHLRPSFRGDLSCL
ncbi:hypothetical protein L915_01871 [Phytophthora nicotianae]|uniref:MULE transposase domain-containing protein n=2 Tax=Phytophthora nicotianae TaxID=4792 RepID=V9FCL8_PHYNI|nr:hypothetical protein F443_07175 [Phytophthora nicotianae P1569]ETK95178.1 hypothetical protein L915_01871 [Phytophthora nicotianae]ETL48572.1 hypothetical protein L916_01839 [Phytophthora nicotianae]